MFSSISVVVATSIVQMIGAIILALVLLGFYKHYRRNYLIHWSWSWWALCVYLLGWVFRSYLAPHFAEAHPLRVTTASLSMAAGYLQVAWLMFGTYELARGTAISRRTSRWVAAILFLAGVASTLVVVTVAAPAMNAVRLGIRSLLLGIACLGASYIVHRMRTEGSAFGRRLVSGGLFLYGVEHFLHLALGISSAAGGSFTPIIYLGLLTFILQSVIGLGMVVWLLEEERERVVRASQQIDLLSYHDPVTGLPNRLLFIDNLKAAMDLARRGGTKVAVLFLDLDRFKVINDSLGHNFGDDLLCQAAGRLRATVKETDTLARLGGDEFAILLSGVEHEEDVRRIGNRLIDAVRAPFDINGQEVYVTASIGITVFPEDGADPETLLKNSDTALYRAKERGRDGCQFYTAAMNARALERLALENSLRKGLINDEFVLHYQPIINVETGEIEGFEALLRWQHPELGMLPPSDFLYIAETLGMMDALNLWVLRRSCSQIRAWQRLGFNSLRVAVNLSARPFQHPDLVTRIRDVLYEAELEAEFLELEITENTAMQDADASLQVLKDLKELGVRISIDDFGTGYSSLSYLRNFPIDTLKIDRSFVRDLTSDTDAAAIASAVIALAHSLKINVVAEGVETEAQRFLLKSQRCDHMQGHLFSRALSAAECEKLLLARQSSLVRLEATSVPNWRTPIWEALPVASD